MNGWMPWTGGKPADYNWTGLDDLSEQGALSENASPNQLHGEHAAATQKG